MRFESERYKFDSDFYDGSMNIGRMLELTIYCKGPTKVQLYLDWKDREALIKAVTSRD